jgi:hypothetical protein
MAEFSPELVAEVNTLRESGLKYSGIQATTGLSFKQVWDIRHPDGKKKAEP